MSKLTPAKKRPERLTLGQLIDQLYAQRAKRIELAREVDEMKSAERLLHTDIINELKSLKLTSSSGAAATATIKSGTVPMVKDWKKFHAYIKRKDKFELLQRRISVTAWQELVDVGTVIPGVEALPTEDLSLTKSSKGA